MNIGSLMTRNVTQVSPDSSFRDAVQLMRERRISCVMAVEGERPVGILTERDLARQFATMLDGVPAVETVAQAMTSPVHTVQSGMPFMEALGVADTSGIRHLPVTNTSGNLVGMVTQSDLVRAYLQIVEFQVQQRTQELVSKSEELASSYAVLHAEEALAKHIFDRLIISQSGEISRVGRVWHRAAGTFSGDLLLVAERPDGCTHVLIADFIGHGLAAALGAIPVSSIFHSMTCKGFELKDIAKEMNRKLVDDLPSNYFCCGAFVEWHPKERSLKVCNAGLPPLMLVDEDGEHVQQIHSRHVPLGIDVDPDLESAWWPVSAEEGARLYAFTDGLVEIDTAALNEDKLLAILRESAPDSRMDALVHNVDRVLTSRELRDDMTLVEFQLRSPLNHAPQLRSVPGALQATG